MTGVTTDPNDPRLTRGNDDQPVAQAPVYLVLSEAERAKGFVRPVRRTYVHVGLDPVRKGAVLLKLGEGGCGAATTMGLAIAETYAREPSFYGGTYCVGCGKHRPVGEFAWDKDGTVVGS